MNSFAQKAPAFDQKEWENFTQDATSKHYYPKLLGRFLQNDTTLADDELALLRFGYTKDEHYSPQGQSFIEDTLLIFNKKQQFDRAIERGEAYLKENPVSLRGNLALVIAYRRLGDVEKQEQHRLHLLQMARGIDASGTFLNYLGYTSSSQSLITPKKGGDFDLLDAVSLKDSSDKRKVYFNVTLLFEEMDKMFK
jgi:hypothetical protein